MTYALPMTKGAPDPTDETVDLSVAELATALLEARRSGHPLNSESLWVPGDPTQAQLVDDRVAQLTDQPVRGWKIGCTSEHAQQVLGSDGPIAGRVYSVLESGTTLSPNQLMGEPNLEGEFAFVLGRDVEPGQAADRSSVVDAIAEVRPAIEVVAGRYTRFLGLPLNQVIADAGGNSHLVLGPAAAGVDPERLATTPGVMTVNGHEAGRGTGADVLGDPINALQWLLANLAERGITLEQGQVVTTGTLTQLAPLPLGGTAVASFGDVGEVILKR